MSTLDGSDGTDDYSRLLAFLDRADLSDHFNDIYFRLRVRRVEDLKDISESDATSVSMTKPEYMRLKRFLKELKDKRDWKGLFGLRSGREKRPVSTVALTTPPTPHVGARYLISRECLKLGKRIGTGEYGEVYQGDWRDEHMSRVSVAIKTLNKDAAPRNEIDIRKEADAMHSLSHPNIIRLYGVVLNVEGPMMLVLELAPLGCLENLLISEGSRFPIMKLYKYAEQIASGMEYLAEKQIVHRDLSTRNLLLVSRDRLKISDFGLARPLPSGKSYYQMTNPKHSKVPFGWTAPEALKTTRFTVQSDVWSYGVTLWEMFSHGACPWGELNAVQILELVDAPLMKRLGRPEHCPQDVYCLMWKCWSHNPDERPTFKALKNLIPTISPATGTVTEPLLVENDPSVLTLKEGDVVTIIECSQPTWCYGQCTSTGVYGKFPCSHIQFDKKKEGPDFGSSPPNGDKLPVLSTDDISKPCNATHNFHIGTHQLAGMTELQLQEMLGSKTIARQPISEVAPGRPRSPLSADAPLSDTRSVTSFNQSTSPPGIQMKTSQQFRPLPTLPRHHSTSHNQTDVPNEPHPVPHPVRITRSQTVDVFHPPVQPNPFRKQPNCTLQAMRQPHSGDLPPPYTPFPRHIGKQLSGNVGGLRQAQPTLSRPHTSSFSDAEYAHLWEARSSGFQRTTVDDSVLANRRSSLISFEEPAIPDDMPNPPPGPYENHLPQELKPGQYASLQLSRETQQNKPSPLQQTSVDEGREEYMVMNSPHSRSPSPFVDDGQSTGRRGTLTRSLSNPEMTPSAVDYVDMTEKKRLMMCNAAKLNEPAQADSVNPLTQSKPIPSNRTTKRSSPKPIPRPRISSSRPRQQTVNPIDEQAMSPLVPPPLPINPPPSSVVSPEKKPLSGPVIKLQKVRKAVPSTSEQDAEEILKLYNGDEETAIRHLKVAQGAELTNYNKEHVKQVTVAYRDPKEAIRYLKVEKVLQFARSAGLKQATTSSCQSALDHCQWNCDRAINFLMGQNK